jgi:hypothetical protein
MSGNLVTDGGPVELTCYMYASHWDLGERRAGFLDEPECNR